jgi:hypothetical protein
VGVHLLVVDQILNLMVVVVVVERVPTAIMLLLEYQVMHQALVAVVVAALDYIQLLVEQL